VWAGHFLLIYVVEAVACQLAAVSVLSPGAGLLVVLDAITILSAFAVATHAWRAWRRRGDDEAVFLARIAIGQDAVATLAILWQLIPLSTVPVCR
jgi:hypothetical protein